MQCYQWELVFTEYKTSYREHSRISWKLQAEKTLRSSLIKGLNKEAKVYIPFSLPQRDCWSKWNNTFLLWLYYCFIILSYISASYGMSVIMHTDFSYSNKLHSVLGIFSENWHSSFLLFLFIYWFWNYNAKESFGGVYPWDIQTHLSLLLNTSFSRRDLCSKNGL